MRQGIKQKAIVVVDNHTEELDAHLEAGWIVVNMCAMTSSSSACVNDKPPQCLVIIQDRYVK